MEIDPSLRRFSEEDRRFARFRINLQYIQRLLIAGLALNEQALAIRHPIDAREIDIGILAHIDAHLARTISLDDVKRNNRIIGASKGVTLFIDARAICANRSARRNLHTTFIDPRDGQATVIGGPPSAFGAVHFFLRDKFRDTPADRASAFGRQRLFRA